MKKLTKKQAKEAIIQAVDAGRVKFSHPDATKMLSGPAVDPKTTEFDYLESEMIAPFNPTEEDRKAWQHDGGIHFRWGLKGFGFGEASIVSRNGKWVADTEHLGRDFLIKILTRWAKQMKIR
jgi:hypothetical protein